MKELSDKEVLQKAIEKALDKGWKKSYREGRVYDEWKYFMINDSQFKANDYYISFPKTSAFEYGMSFMDIIFSNDFAKAFWGEEIAHYTSVDVMRGYHPKIRLYQERWEVEEYKYHLQQMVLEENPINYLRKFI
jgi:hypothetical protein